MDTSHVSRMGALVGDAFGQMAKVLQNEVALAKAEVAEDVSRAVTNIALILAGAVLLIPALVLLLFGLAAAMIAGGMTSTAGYLTAGVVGLVLAIVLFLIGAMRLKKTSFVPTRTLEQFNKDKQALAKVAK